MSHPEDTGEQLWGRIERLKSADARPAEQNGGPQGAAEDESLALFADQVFSALHQPAAASGNAGARARLAEAIARDSAARLPAPAAVRPPFGSAAPSPARRRPFLIQWNRQAILLAVLLGLLVVAGSIWATQRAYQAYRAYQARCALQAGPPSGYSGSGKP